MKAFIFTFGEQVNIPMVLERLEEGASLVVAPEALRHGVVHKLYYKSESTKSMIEQALAGLSFRDLDKATITKDHGVCVMSLTQIEDDLASRLSKAGFETYTEFEDPFNAGVFFTRDELHSIMATTEFGKSIDYKVFEKIFGGRNVNFGFNFLIEDEPLIDNTNSELRLKNHKLLNAKRQVFGPTKETMKTVSLCETDIGKIFYINPENTTYGILSSEEFVLLDPDTVGGWLEIGQLDVLFQEK